MFYLRTISFDLFRIFGVNSYSYKHELAVFYGRSFDSLLKMLVLRTDEFICCDNLYENLSIVGLPVNSSSSVLLISLRRFVIFSSFSLTNFSWSFRKPCRDRLTRVLSLILGSNVHS